MPVDLDGEEIVLRLGLGHAPGRVAVAEADLQDDRSVVAEGGGKIQYAAPGFDAPVRPELVQRTFLPVCQAASAQHETAHRAPFAGLLSGRSFVRGKVAHGGSIVASAT